MSKNYDWLPWALAAGGAAVVGYALITDTRAVIGNSGPILVKSVGNGQYMKSDAADAFNAMVLAAASDGVTLIAGSAFRSMAEQAVLYAKYMAGLNIVNGSNAKAAAPGTSNHGNGIAVDIAGASGRTIDYGSREYTWLMAMAGTYLFSWDEGRQINEPWHWDFVG